MEIWDAIATERRALADELEGLTAEQWNAQTVCDGWTVRHMLAHLVTPFDVSTPRFLLAMAARRFDLHKVTVHFAAKHVERPIDELIDSLRANATNRWMPPKTGPEVPLGEILVHGQDIRAAIGARRTVPAELVDALMAGIDDAEIRADYAVRLAAPAETARTT